MKAGIYSDRFLKPSLLVLTAIFSLFLQVTFAGDVTLAWDPNNQPDLAGYRLSYGPASLQYDTVLDVGKATTYTIPDLAAGIYYFTVQAYGTGGEESGFSNEVSTIISDSKDTPPQAIQNIGATSIGQSTATIVWITDQMSTSQIEYGTTERYGSSTLLDSYLALIHSQALTGLAAGTTYHYRIKSIDASGNLTFSPDFTFSTAGSRPQDLVFPRFSSGQNMIGEDSMVGFAVVNLSPQSAALNFSALDDDGNLTSGPQITNPVANIMDPMARICMIDWELFGTGLAESNSNGWVKLESNAPDMSGLFLIFDKDLNLMDGTSFVKTALADFAFTEIQEDGYNRISVINSNSHAAVVDFSLVRKDGSIRSSRTREIQGNSAISADLFGDLFAGINPHKTDYVLVESDSGLRSFLVMRQKAGDIAMLEGQDISAGGTKLYAPQYVIGGAYQTTLSVVNLDRRSGMVTFRLISHDGIPIGALKTLPIPAMGKLLIEDQTFFLAADQSEMLMGYVEIVSDGIRLAGSVQFGDPNHETFTSSLALISHLQNSVLYSHVASDDVYFTGLALLNPNPVDIQVEIELYSPEGSLVDRKEVWIGARQSDTRLLTQFFPSLEGRQASGYFRVISDSYFGSFALFGTHNLSVLSAIPPH